MPAYTWVPATRSRRVTIAPDGPAGVGADVAERLEGQLLERYPPAPRRMQVSAGAAAVLVIAAVAALLAGPTWLAVLSFLGAAISAIVALVAVRDQHKRRRELEADEADTRGSLAVAAERAKKLEGVRLDTAAEARRLVAALQSRLAGDLA